MTKVANNELQARMQQFLTGKYQQFPELEEPAEAFRGTSFPRFDIRGGLAY